jgi:fatty-acyl-CoA synthase
LYCNTAFAAPQLEQVVDREQPVGLIYDEEFRELIEQAGGDRKRWVAWRDDAGGADPSLAELIDRGDDSDLAAPPGAGRSVLLTSGSTGTPKGAARGRPQVLSSISALLSRIPLAAREPTVMAAPLFHAWGFLHLQFGMLLASTLVLRRRFDPEGTLAAIDRNKATALAIVPVMMQRILELDADTIGRYDTSSLRVVAASGGALPAELGRRWMDKFGDNLYNLYGSTEVAWAAIATPADLRAAPGTSGSAPPGTSLKILDDEHRDLPSGETGQIYVRSEMLFEGYTGGGSEDLVDGHLATGDLGYLDEAGRLFVEGRADEMIVSGGENVYPQEVEQTLQEHDAVREAAVIGVDDEEFGQRLKAFVVADRDVSADELKSHVKSHLAGFKVPRDITRVEELPRKPQGKVDKQKLAEGDRHGAGED